MPRLRDRTFHIEGQPRVRLGRNATGHDLENVAAELDEESRAFLQRVALLISPHCLVGWDTRGEAWSP